MEAAKAATTNLSEALGDFARLVGKAFLGGVGVAIALALIALGLATVAQAQPLPQAQPLKLNDPQTGTLLLKGDAAGQYRAAPKVQTDVSIQVTGIVARTRVEQVFHNPATDTVDGVYVFPLPENAAVDRLWMKVGSRTIEGQVKEKEEARVAFLQARNEGKKASLVEQQRPNLFTNAVANIGPDEWVRISIEYQQTLAYDNGEYRLRFPLAITPRYDPLPLGDMKDDGRDDDGLEPILHPDYSPCGCADANRVSIAVTLDAGRPLSKVASSIEGAWVERETDTRTAVFVSQEQHLADRDFELTWAPAAGTAPDAMLFTETHQGTDYALLMVVPPQPTAVEKAAAPRLPRETILIIDTSGSMQGTSIQQARAALQMALDTLTPADRFNVVEFNSILRTLYPDALPATPANVQQAREWVEKLRATGGTEMAPALRFALDGRETPGYLRQVIFVTDGAVGNEDQLFKMIAQRLGASRLFTVGIGSAPNSHFMTKAAQFGRGTFTHIGDVREVQDKMSRLFAKIEAPVLTDVTVRWPDGSAVETFPARVPDLYLGEPIVVAAANVKGRGAVVVTGRRGNQPWSVALTPDSPKESSGVGVLWARAKIASLMDELRLGGDVATIRPAVLKVALDHHLVSAYTSLIAVDVTPTAPLGEKRLAIVKANLPAGQTLGELPQTDTESTLQMLLGLFALLAAAMVALIGRAMPARRGE